ncbi:hypothetical protein KFK09_022746 [Dendrobium nobile]|uniref:Uncharacterized protein n=1 Tax=Dendrobium nobile TaxID=94219 RepID=A0A8T3AK04_DENNO|nr:hypothetical protein KFK09_022746 [Dendrobium nobile]
MKFKFVSNVVPDFKAKDVLESSKKNNNPVAEKVVTKDVEKESSQMLLYNTEGCKSVADPALLEDGEFVPNDGNFGVGVKGHGVNSSLQVELCGLEIAIDNPLDHAAVSLVPEGVMADKVGDVDVIIPKPEECSWCQRKQCWRC